MEPEINKININVEKSIITIVYTTPAGKKVCTLCGKTYLLMCNRLVSRSNKRIYDVIKLTLFTFIRLQNLF